MEMKKTKTKTKNEPLPPFLLTKYCCIIDRFSWSKAFLRDSMICSEVTLDSASLLGFCSMFVTVLPVPRTPPAK